MWAMKANRTSAIIAIAFACVLAAAGVACASKAESPTPSEEPRTAATTPTAPPACPTSPATPPATARVTATAEVVGQATLTGVTAEATTCTDRITFTFSGGGLPGYDVRYEKGWTTCGKGDTVTTAGPAQLIVQFRDTNAHDEAGNSTAPRSLKPDLPSLKEAVQTCDFEADVAWALGTDENPFTVTTLHNPERVVVEIAH